MILTPQKNGYKVFLSDNEYQTYLKNCSERTKIAARIMAETSTRPDKCTKLTLNDFYIPDHEEIKIAFVLLEGTKDTTGDTTIVDGKRRVSWVPMSLYEKVQSYCEEKNREGNDPVLDIKYDQMKDNIKEAGKITARQTGVEGYKYITPQDMRTFYATHMARKEDLDIETVMAMGGWSTYKAMEPYLRAPLEQELQKELAAAGVLEIDIETSRRGWRGTIEQRLTAIEHALRLRDAGVDLGELTRSEIEEIIGGSNNVDFDPYDTDQPGITDFADD